MKTSLFLTILFGMAFMARPVLSEEKAATAEATPAVATAPVAAPNGMPSEAEMMKQMMDLAKLGDNHKLLAGLDGTWNYTLKMWMDGDTTKKGQESKGVAVRKSVMEGRYSQMDVTGEMSIPGEGGKMKKMTFKGHALDAYDNVKKKFVSTWIDNMGTGIMMSEGDYDSATKALTYTGEMEPMPGMKVKIREVIKLTDKNHMLLEWYEMRGPQEMKTMEIAYTRAGGKK